MATRHLVLFLVFLSMCIVSAAWADVPRMLSYQGKLTNAGQAVANGTCNMRFTLYDQATGGNLLWVEPALASSARAVPVADGVFSVLMGSLVPIPEAAFAGNAFLQVEVNGTVLTPRTQIVSVGYAYHALNADTVPDNSITAPKIANGAVTPAKISTTGATTGQVLTYNGTTAAWANTPPFTLPYAGSVASASAAVSISNTGSGTALAGSAKGTNGAAGFFEVTNAANPSSALFAINNGGSGNAADVILNTPGGTGTALKVQSVASGPVIRGETINSGTVIDAVASGNGKAGAFQVSNGNSSSDVLTATTNGTGRAGYFSIINGASGSSALVGTTSGTGSGLYGLSSSTGVGATGISTGGYGVYGSSGTGNGGFFTVTGPNTLKPALYAMTQGIGPTATFAHGNTASGSPTLWVTNNGLGNGIEVDINNAGSTAPGVQIGTNSAGPALSAYTTGANAGVQAQNMGTGPALKAFATGTAGEAIIAKVTKSANGCSAIYATSVSPSSTINATNSHASGEAGMFQIDNPYSAGTALHAKTVGTGKAGYFEGDVHITGKASGPYLPLAFGVVKPDGSKYSGTPNFTSGLYTDSVGEPVYVLDVEGVTGNEVVLVTAGSGNSVWDVGVTACAWTNPGKVIVYLSHASNDAVQGWFHFMVYGTP